ncbi:hypothetical protein OJAV_G00158670 [Oryzias javanicus]|uniref:Uncharacterized protein n=1 Tax=Oryzias javanicus TaxID=123683 RepID=A0A437CJ41_ORYJA|nr:hypothetical protein OJAV_G00158670 [Oryzias javanicus]
MKNTFVCDESMIITIPGKAQPLGAAQAVFGLLLCALALVFYDTYFWIFTIPSIVFVICGGLSFAAGKCPNMIVAKLSFSLNILSLCWSITSFVLNLIILIEHYWYPSYYPYYRRNEEILALILSLLVIEFFICIFLIYWLSKAICRQHFNMLPTIVLKRGN